MSLVSKCLTLEVKSEGTINKLVDLNAKRLKVEKEDRLALLKFREEEAEADWKDERELAELYVGHNRNLSYQA